MALLAAMAAVGASADLLASDLPLVARLDGRLYLFPCVARPPALIDHDQQTLAGRASFLLRTPIPYGPHASRPGGVQSPLDPPSARHLLGTDDRGRDVAARLIHGFRTAFLIGPLAVVLYLTLGLALGLAAASSPAIDLVVGRVIEVGLTFPALFLLLAVQAAWGAPSTGEVVLAIALTRWPDVARLARSGARTAAAMPHVEAARAIGAGPLRIALRHLLPLALGPAVVAAAFGIGHAVLIEAGLSFLGLGVPPPTASWGEMLAEARAAGLPWWLVIAPSVALAATVLASNRAADAIRARLDPRSPRP